MSFIEKLIEPKAQLAIEQQPLVLQEFIRLFNKQLIQHISDDGTGEYVTTSIYKSVMVKEALPAVVLIRSGLDTSGEEQTAGILFYLNEEYLFTFIEDLNGQVLNGVESALGNAQYFVYMREFRAQRIFPEVQSAVLG